MKKFLIGIIFVIPVVVVLALNATSAIILGTTPVNPTELIVKNSDNVVLKRGDIVKVDINATDEFIIFEVLPGITKDKAITYEIDEDAGSGRVRLERIGSTDRYSVIPEAVGICKLDVRAKANVNVYAEVTVNVTTDSIETVTIYDSEGKAVGNSLDITSSTRLIADIYPIDALYNGAVTWSSSVESVATINENGIITPVSHGVTRINFVVQDKDGNRIYKYVDVDTTKCVARTERVYTSAVVDAEWVRANIALSPTNTIVSCVDGGYELVYEKGEFYGKSIVTVSECDEGALGFIDGVDVVYTNNGPYITSIGYLESRVAVKAGVSYQSSAPDVMTIDGAGVLTPLKAGETVISATYDGIKIEKTYIVRERPATFELALGSADNKLGIQLKRTWGLYWLNESEDGTIAPWDEGKRYDLTNTYRFGLLDDKGSFDVVWSVDNPEYASVAPTGENNDVDITFNEAVAGNTVTVYATLLVDNRKVDKVRRSFKFSFQSKAKSVNIYDYEQMKSVINAQEYDLVLQHDIVVTCTYGIFSSIYGNGFTLDYAELSAGKEESNYWRVLSPKRMYGYNDTYDRQNGIGDGAFVIEELVVKGANSVEEAGNTGCIIEFNEMDTPIEIRYCQVYNTTEGLNFHKCKNVLIEGCIFGDNYLASASFGYYDHWEGNIVLRNNVFKTSGGAAVQVYMDWVAPQTINMPIKANIKIEGFMDVYNWKERSEIQNILVKTLLVRVGTDLIPVDSREAISQQVGKLLDPIINGAAFNDMFYKHGGKEYASFGILGIGLMGIAEADRVTIDPAARMQAMVLSLKDENGEPYPSLAAADALTQFITKIPDITVSNDCYLVCTDFSKGDPYIEPGDPVPNSRDLYDDLVNGRQAD